MQCLCRPQDVVKYKSSVTVNITSITGKTLLSSVLSRCTKVNWTSINSVVYCVYTPMWILLNWALKPYFCILTVAVIFREPHVTGEPMSHFHLLVKTCYAIFVALYLLVTLYLDGILSFLRDYYKCVHHMPVSPNSSTLDFTNKVIP